MNLPIIDLTQQFPRSPHELLGGFAHLARMIDKVRAKEVGKLGEYIYPCPLDTRLLDFLSLDSDDFHHAVIDQSTDEDISKWVTQHSRKASQSEIEEWNGKFLTRKPDNPESLKRFTQLREKIASDRQDGTAWVDLLDLDEDRPVPIRHNSL